MLKTPDFSPRSGVRWCECGRRGCWQLSWAASSYQRSCKLALIVCRWESSFDILHGLLVWKSLHVVNVCGQVVLVVGIQEDHLSFVHDGGVIEKARKIIVNKTHVYHLNTICPPNSTSVSSNWKQSAEPFRIQVYFWTGVEEAATGREFLYLYNHVYLDELRIFVLSSPTFEKFARSN